MKRMRGKDDAKDMHKASPARDDAPTNPRKGGKAEALPINPDKRRKTEVGSVRDASLRQKETDELLKKLQLTFESSSQRMSVLEKDLVGKTNMLKEASRRLADLEEGLEHKKEEGLALKKKIQQLQEALTCCICLQRSSLFLFDCGHSFCCGDECQSSLYTSCPQCKVPVTKKIKLFSTSNFATVAIQSDDVQDDDDKEVDSVMQEAAAWTRSHHEETSALEDEISAINKSSDNLSTDFHRIQNALASSIDTHARNVDTIQNFVEGLALFSDAQHLNPSILEVFSEKKSLQIKKDLIVRKKIEQSFQSGAIEDVFKQMGRNTDRAGIQEKAVRVIQKLINKKENEALWKSLKSTSGVEKIVQAMVNHEDSEGLQMMGCEILRKVAETRIELLTSVKGIVEALCNAIRLFGRKSTVQTDVCKTMILLSSEKDNTNMRVHLVEGLIQAMCWNLNNEEIQIAGCRVIRNLSILEEEKVSVCRHGGVKSVVNAMKNHTKSTRVQIQGCAALMNIAGNSNSSVPDSIMHKVHEVVGGSNAIEVVVDAMRSHRDNEEVQIHGIAAIRNLAWSQKLKLMIAPAGGIEEVISAMRNFPLNSQIQVHGCAAVKNLSSNAVENKKRIGEEGGIAAMLSTLELHVQNQDVMMQACAALRNLASLEQNKQTLKELGGSKFVIDAVLAHPTNQAIQEHSSKILKMLSTVSSVQKDQEESSSSQRPKNKDENSSDATKDHPTSRLHEILPPAQDRRGLTSVTVPKDVEKSTKSTGGDPQERGSKATDSPSSSVSDREKGKTDPPLPSQTSLGDAIDYHPPPGWKIFQQLTLEQHDALERLPWGSKFKLVHRFETFWSEGTFRRRGVRKGKTGYWVRYVSSNQVEEWLHELNYDEYGPDKVWCIIQQEEK